MKTADISVQLIDYCGTDLSVVNAARVSFEKESEWEWEVIDSSDERVLSSKDKKLISYLARHQHISPFNHCFASFRVKAPIFVARQLVKHKFLPWNEVSRRYVDSEPEFFIPEVWRKRAENVKQGSSQEAVQILYGNEPYDIPETVVEVVQRHTKDTLTIYTDMLQVGVCPEMARMVLPQNTMTEWIWSGTLGAWADMCRLRLDPHAQYETRLFAEKISTEMKDLFPVSWGAVLETQ